MLNFKLYSKPALPTSKDNTQTTIQTNVIPNNTTETFYVTKSGHKYHRSNCKWIYGQEVRALTSDEIKDWLPCKDCIGTDTK